MFPDVGRWPKRCWRTHFQVEKSLHWAHLRSGWRYHGNSKAYTDIFDHAWYSWACVDVSQCWLMTDTVFVLETQLQVEKSFHWGYLRTGKRYHRNSKTYPHIFDHARLNGLSADIAWCLVYNRWKRSWKTSSRWKNSFIGVGQLVGTGPIVVGVDENVG